jgi:oxygen-independent coproporphyrinogen-3 oxidase
MSKMIQTEKWKPKDDVAQEHFMILLDTLESNGFIHYELSNFGKQNYFSKITRLLVGKKYMGIGPSAHGYNGISSWNVSNNIIYLKSIQEEKLPNIEVLRNGSLQ